MIAEEIEHLKGIARYLPALEIHSSEKRMVKGSEILGWNTVDEIEGKSIDPEKMYQWNYPVITFANHYRRLKRRYIKNGMEGVMAYLKMIDKLMVQQKQS